MVNLTPGEIETFRRSRRQVELWLRCRWWLLAGWVVGVCAVSKSAGDGWLVVPVLAVMLVLLFAWKPRVDATVLDVLSRYINDDPRAVAATSA